MDHENFMFTKVEIIKKNAHKFINEIDLWLEPFYYIITIKYFPFCTIWNGSDLKNITFLIRTKDRMNQMKNKNSPMLNPQNNKSIT